MISWLLISMHFSTKLSLPADPLTFPDTWKGFFIYWNWSFPLLILKSNAAAKYSGYFTRGKAAPDMWAWTSRYQLHHYKTLIKYQVFHQPGDTINLLLFIFLNSFNWYVSLMKIWSQLEFKMYHAACLVCSLLKKIMNFRLAFKRIEDLMLGLEGV